MLPSLGSRLVRSSWVSREPRVPDSGGEVSELVDDEAVEVASGAGACREAVGRLAVVEVPSAGLRIDDMVLERSVEREVDDEARVCSPSHLAAWSFGARDFCVASEM